MTAGARLDRLLAEVERRLRPGPPAEPVDPSDAALEALAAAERPVVLAGPGVVADGCVPGLQAFAAAGSLGVLNTWGAKGVFHWRSPHHLATAGLQARDFELGGLASADLIVATGVDPAEAPPELWRVAPVFELAPAALGVAAAQWSRPRRDIEVPPLRAGLAAVTQEGWASSSVPLAPSLVTRHYAEVLGDGGLVAADPGTAGYWVARTFATTALGGAQVTADPRGDGFAVACCVAARLVDPARPVLAVLDGPLPADIEELLGEADRRGVAVPVEVWSAVGEGDHLEPDAHLERLRAIVGGAGAGVVTLATDPRQLDAMIAVAGEIIAWPGRPSAR